MRQIKRRYLKFHYHQADIPYYHLNGKCSISYYRYDADHHRLHGGREIGIVMRMWINPTPASLARLARFAYQITIDSGYCEDRWYIHGISDYVTFDFTV